MIEWIISTVPIFKAVHIVGLMIWCGGLMVLPLVISRHHPEISVDEYHRIRLASHITYTMCVTPAAVITIIAGTWLIFLRETFTPWLYAKLAMVTLLMAAHGWIGHLVTLIGEDPNKHKPPAPYLPIMCVLVPTLAALVLVLAKPTLAWIEFPDWLTEPQDNQLFFEVPRR